MALRTRQDDLHPDPSGMTVEEILLRGPGVRRGQPVRSAPTATPRPQPRRPHYPPPRQGLLVRWARNNPLMAALLAYALWMLAWGAHIWRSSAGG